MMVLLVLQLPATRPNIAVDTRSFVGDYAPLVIPCSFFYLREFLVSCAFLLRNQKLLVRHFALDLTGGVRRRFFFLSLVLYLAI